MSIVPTGMIVSYLARKPRSKAISGIMLSALAKIWNILNVAMVLALIWKNYI